MRSGMNRKKKMASTVIQGADGPTSVFIAGKGRDRNGIRQIRTWMQRKRYQRKRARVAAGLTAEAHSLTEVCVYIRKKYHAEEVDASDLHYKGQYKSLKASMIQKYQPEQFPFDFHQYQITVDGCGRLDIVIDFTHDFISYSYSAEKGGRRVMDGIVKDIWLYYGVSREDIEQESERMQALLTILASMQ